MDKNSLQRALVDVALVRRYFFYDQTDSTMNQGRRLLAEGSEAHQHGTLIVANHQQTGRGRHGRTWSAPPASSLLSTLILSRRELPFSEDARQLSLLAAAIPVAVCRGINRLVPEARIKYPNDIVTGERKLGGILLEQCGGAVLAGFGINCHQELAELPADLRMPASSLFLETGRRHSREKVLVAVLEEINSVLASEDTFERAAEEMQALCETLGRPICIDRGRDVLTGVARRIQADGTLVVETIDGPETVYTSEVLRTWSPDTGE